MVLILADFKLSDLEFPKNDLLLVEISHEVQFFLDRLNESIITFEMRFSASGCRLGLQNGICLKSNLLEQEICGKQIDHTNRLVTSHLVVVYSMRCHRICSRQD